MLGRWSSEYLVQRQERSHGRGIPDHPMRPTTRSTPVRRQGQPQTEIRSCENPRMRVCSPTSQGFAPTVARSSYQQLLARLWRGRAVAPPRLTKDIRGWAKAPARNGDATKALAWRRAHASVEREHRPNAWARRARRRPRLWFGLGWRAFAHPTAHLFDRTKL